MYKVTEHNVSTGEVIVRDATEQEIEQLEKDIETAKKLDQAAQENKEKKIALLEKLGITEEEAKLLLS